MCGSWRPLSTMWVPGIELRSSGLVEDTIIHRSVPPVLFLSLPKSRRNGAESAHWLTGGGDLWRQSRTALWRALAITVGSTRALPQLLPTQDFCSWLVNQREQVLLVGSFISMPFRHNFQWPRHKPTRKTPWEVYHF